MGIEWFALLIPATVGLLLHYHFHKKVLWWEALLPLLPVLIGIPVTKLAVETYQTSDTERRGGWVVEARYYEDWNEYVHQTCTRSVSCGKDCTREETYDCSHVDYHPPYWEVEDSNGYIRSITKKEFEWLAERFKSRVFVELYRHYHTDDGDLYRARWAGNDDAFQPYVTSHTYENRVQAAEGVLDYHKVLDPKQKGLFEYPRLTNPFNDRAFLGDCPGWPQADGLLQKANATMGRNKQIRFWFLVFKNKPVTIAREQEAYWIGGNKNELVTCVSLDKDNQVQWAHVFCWSPEGYAGNHELKIEIRDALLAQKPFDPVAAVKVAIAKAKEKFKRKSFKEFSYVHVEPPWWAIWLIYILTCLLTGGMAWYIMENEITD